ncbi:hypothetical protein WJX79_002274 [Trebouxia sp. C0005]
MVSACLQSTIVRPTVKSQTPRSARSIRAPIRCSAHKNGTGHVEASRLAALAAAASLLLAQPSFAGPLSDKLPDSSPAPPKEKVRERPWSLVAVCQASQSHCPSHQHLRPSLDGDEARVRHYTR